MASGQTGTDGVLDPNALSVAARQKEARAVGESFLDLLHSVKMPEVQLGDALRISVYPNEVRGCSQAQEPLEIDPDEKGDVVIVSVQELGISNPADEPGQQRSLPGGSAGKELAGKVDPEGPGRFVSSRQEAESVRNRGLALAVPLVGDGNGCHGNGIEGLCYRRQDPGKKTGRLRRVEDMSAELG